MKRIISIISIALVMAACSEKNPFLAEWDTPYGIPPYEEIEVEDYIPAIQKGIEQQNAEIEAITSNPDAPTFENTIVPLELSGGILSKVSGVLYNVSETDRSDSLDAVMSQAIPLLSEHGDNINFNKELYGRIAAIYEGDQSALTREQQVVLKKYYDSFTRNGIDLPEETQARLREINSEMATKTQQIGNNILAESNAFAARFGFSVSEYPARMTTTEDRELRRQYNEAYTSRGNNGNEYDNNQLILDRAVHPRRQDGRHPREGGRFPGRHHGSRSGQGQGGAGRHAGFHGRGHQGGAASGGLENRALGLVVLRREGAQGQI